MNKNCFGKKLLLSIRVLFKISFRKFRNEIVLISIKK
jgi:hypothetical protein